MGNKTYLATKEDVAATNTQVSNLQTVVQDPDTGIESKVSANETEVQQVKTTIGEDDTSGLRLRISDTETAIGDSNNGLTKQVADLEATKQDEVTGAATTIVADNLTVSRVVESDVEGKLIASTITSDELANLEGTTSAVQTQIDSINDRVDVAESESWTLVALVQALDTEALAKTVLYDMPETHGEFYVEKTADSGFNFVYGKTTTTDTYIHGDVTIRRNSLGTSTLFDSTNIESYVMSRNAFASAHINTLVSDLKDYNSAEITLTVNREWDSVDGQISRDVAYMYHFRISRGYGGQADYTDRCAVFAKREKIIIDNTHLFVRAI